MREYLTVLETLLRGEEVSFQGEHYRVEGGFTVPGTSAVSVVVGALSPRMVQVAGELSDGTVTWLAGRRTLTEDIVPALHEAAAASGRLPPRVIAGLPVALADPDEARTVAQSRFARYGGLENYRKVFEREGVESVAELALVGGESDLERELVGYAEAGVIELWPAVFPVGADAKASLDRTRAFLAQLGRSARPRRRPQGSGRSVSGRSSGRHRRRSDWPRPGPQTGRTRGAARSPSE